MMSTQIIVKQAKIWWVWNEYLLWTKLCSPKIHYVEALTPNVTIFGDRAFKEVIMGTSLVVHWVRLHAPNAGGPGSIPCRGTRSHMHATTKSLHAATRVHMPQLQIPRAATKRAAMKLPRAATKTRRSQNKFFLKRGDYG